MIIKNPLNEALCVEKLHEQFVSAKPFPHVVIDDFLKNEIAEKLSHEFPSVQDPIWYEYDNPIEKKSACDDIRKFPASIASTIHYLNSSYFLDFIQKVSGISDLDSDPYLHGGGIHCTKKGGKLDMHLDYSIHPKSKLERRLNLIIYLSKEWDPAWGGKLELWNQDMSNCEQTVDIKWNRAVLFATNDISYHGHPDPIDCPDDTTRNSIALYYLTEPQPNASDRPRALFVARPQDSKDQETEDFRKKRSQVIGVY